MTGELHMQQFTKLKFPRRCVMDRFRVVCGGICVDARTCWIPLLACMGSTAVWLAIIGIVVGSGSVICFDASGRLIPMCIATACIGWIVMAVFFRIVLLCGYTCIERNRTYGGQRDMEIMEVV